MVPTVKYNAILQQAIKDNVDCPRCQEARENGFNFCAGCGRKPEERPGYQESESK